MQKTIQAYARNSVFCKVSLGVSAKKTSCRGFEHTHLVLGWNSVTVCPWNRAGNQGFNTISQVRSTSRSIGKSCRTVDSLWKLLPSIYLGLDRLRPEAIRLYNYIFSFLYTDYQHIHIMPGAGDLERWTHYTWHYITRETFNFG